MARERQHLYRERGGTVGQSGETYRSRDHHALRNGWGIIISDLLPSGAEDHRSIEKLKSLKANGGQRLMNAKIVFIAHEEQYRKTGEDGQVQTFTHGVNDGLENSTPYNGKPTGHSWLETGSGFNPRNVIKHDWQTSSYTRPPYK